MSVRACHGSFHRHARKRRLWLPSTRLITTGAAIHPQAHTPPVELRSEISSRANDRLETVRNAKPFSDFLTDTFQRQHDYLRVSVTERCNLRCLYCMPEEGIELSPSKSILTSAEIYYLSALFVNQGVTKIRLTGGEPTVRKDIIPLMQQIGSLRKNGLKELALTTNAISLHRKLDAMVEAGLTGVNISLDTLDPFQFQLLTRRQGFDAVMKSINRVQEMNRTGAGIKLKINAVVMRGLNDHQILPFVEMTREQDVEVRFIEYMPFGGNKWSENKMLPYSEMLDMIREKYPSFNRLKGAKNDTSKTWQVEGFKGRVGFITSMTHNFCGSCNRLRITSDGNLKVCLHGNAEVSLRDILRQDHNGEPMDEQAFEAIRQHELDRRRSTMLLHNGEEGWATKEKQLLDVIGAAVKRKEAKHAGMGELENMKNRPMILIGDTSTSLNGQARLLRNESFSGSRVPLHLLHKPYSHQTRAYSSTSDEKPLPETTEETSEDTKVENSPIAPLTLPMLGFQSLRVLFPQPSKQYDEPLDDQSEQPDTVTQPMEETRTSTDHVKPHTTSTVQDSSSIHIPSSGDSSWGSPPEERSLLEIPSRETPSNTSILGESNRGSTLDDVPSSPSTTRERDLRWSIWSPEEPTREKPSVIRNHSTKHHRTNYFEFRSIMESTTPAENADAGLKAGVVRKETTSSRWERDAQHRSWKKVAAPVPTTKSFLNPTLRTTAEKNPGRNARKGLLNNKTQNSLTNPFLPTTSGNSTGSESDNGNSTSWLRYSGDAPQENSWPPVPDTRTSTDQAPTSSSQTAKGAPPAQLSHVNSAGEAHMVDVGHKPTTDRIAIATSRVVFSTPHTCALVTTNQMKKGDVLGTARIAGVMAAKRSAELIPLCHSLSLSRVDIVFRFVHPGGMLQGGRKVRHGALEICAQARCHGQTGVEMEALTAAAVAGLTVYDMCKAVDKGMSVDACKLAFKAGGKSHVMVKPFPPIAQEWLDAWQRERAGEEEES